MSKLPLQRERRVVGAVAVVVATIVCGAGCGGASADPGLDALVLVEDAQFVPGPIALADTDDGPSILTLAAARSVTAPGQRDEPLSGTLEASAEAVALGVVDDVGHWILPAGPPDSATPGLPTLTASLAFSTALPEGPLALVARAVDGAGRSGPPLTTIFVVDDRAPPEGPLVVSLGWDTDADLDLHVVLPDGVEVWSGNTNSVVRPGPGEPPLPPDAFRAGAQLDVDSTANCVDDGLRQENVVWSSTTTPAPGPYRVRVETSALCGRPVARWWVVVRRDRVVVASAEGSSLPVDTRGPHGEGSGLLALDFTL